MQPVHRPGERYFSTDEEEDDESQSPKSPDLRSPANEELEATQLHTALSGIADSYSAYGLNESSRFFAHHTSILKPDLSENRIRLARIYASMGNHSHVLHILSGRTDGNVEMKLLASQALFHLRRYDECIDLLGDEDDDSNADTDTDSNANANADADTNTNIGLNSNTDADGKLNPRHGKDPARLRAALYVMRAKVYEQQDNVIKAVSWYKRALEADFCCFDAFDSIVNKCLVCPDEAATFVNQLTRPYLTSVGEAGGEEESDAKKAAGSVGTGLTKFGSEGGHNASLIWLARFYQASIDSTYPIPVLAPVPAPQAQVPQPSLDIIYLKAKRLYQRLDFGNVLGVLNSIMFEDTLLYNNVSNECIQIYLVSLVEMEDRQKLFCVAHQLIDRDPKSWISWLAVAYYYLSSGKYDISRRFLRKCTMLQHRNLAAWIALGHAFALQDESDQAMASYRTAQRLFPGALTPPLFIGMEYLRQGALSQAHHYLCNAKMACEHDPAPLHELGVVAYRQGELSTAIEYFTKVLSIWSQTEMEEKADAYHHSHSHSHLHVSDSGASGGPGGRRVEAKEICLVNLGHCYRRLGEYAKAKHCYQQALVLKPRVHTTCIALGITFHACGDYEAAVSMYHNALRDCAGDAIANELLERALFDLSTYRS